MPQVSMTVRMDNQQKALFDKLCEQFGMSANTAINVFVKAVIRTKRIPFPIAATSIEEKSITDSIAAFEQIRSAAEKGDTPELSLNEINAEINEVRQLKKSRNGVRSY